LAYIELFVGPVLTVNKNAYDTYAAKMGALTMKAGAISVAACWEEESPLGMLKSLASVVQLEPGETLVARIVRWRSKEARDEGWAGMMNDPAMQSEPIQMPFDRTRVCHAGFDELGGA
jgi:uncharacterized protein YbaA (DUF1428 family)